MTSKTLPAAEGAASIIASGRLRIGLFPSFFYSRAPVTGEFVGWGIEMARELAEHLGVSLQLVECASPPAVVDALRKGDCDAAFLGISPPRAAEVDFSPPWVQADFTFVVAAGSGIACIADADQPGARIAVVRNHAMDAALQGKLAHASQVYADTPDEAFGLLVQGKADVLAGIRPGLLAYAARSAGYRVLADRYGANVIGLAVAKGKADWHACISAFVAHSKTSGSAAAGAARAGAKGLEVVP